MAKNFNAMLSEGLNSRANEPVHSRLTLNCGTPSKYSQWYLQDIECGVKILDNSCVFKSIDFKSLVFLDSILKKIHTEWPQRMLHVTAVENKGAEFCVLYDDNYIITSSTRVHEISNVSPLYVGIRFIVLQMPLNVVIWEVLLLRVFQHTKNKFVHGNKHFVCFGINRPAETVVCVYTKENVITVTVKESSAEKVTSTLQEIDRVCAVYRRLRNECPQDPLETLVNPKLTKHHVYNFRELKIMSYCFAYRLNPDSKCVHALRNSYLPNLYPERDSKFYAYIKTKAMRNMTKFANRISLETNSVCTYSRRPCIEELPDSPFLTCSPPKIASSGGLYAFFKLTIDQGKFSVPNCMTCIMPANCNYFMALKEIKTRTEAWQHMYKSTLSDYLVVPITWDIRSNNLCVDVCSLGKLNMYTNVENWRRVKYYVLLNNNNMSTEVVRVYVHGDSKNPSDYVPVESVPNLMKDLTVASVNKRLEIKKSLSKETTEIARYGKSDATSAVVFCSESGGNSILFGASVRFVKRNTPTCTACVSPYDPDSLRIDRFAKRIISGANIDNVAGTKLSGNELIVIYKTFAEWKFFKYLQRVFPDNELRLVWCFNSLRKYLNGLVLRVLNEIYERNEIPCGECTNQESKLAEACDIYFTHNVWEMIHLIHFWNVITRDSKEISIMEDDCKKINLQTIRAAQNLILEKILSEREVINVFEGGSNIIMTYTKMLLKKNIQKYPFLSSDKILDYMTRVRLRSSRQRFAESNKSQKEYDIALFGDVMDIRKCVKEMKENYLTKTIMCVELLPNIKKLKPTGELHSSTNSKTEGDSDNEDMCNDELDEDEEEGPTTSETIKQLIFINAFDNMICVARIDHNNYIRKCESSMPVVL